MKLIQNLILAVALAALLVSCAENSVTEGPTRSAKTRTSTSTTTVEEPAPVDIQTKPGSQYQNSLRHGQPDQPDY
jgi:type IV pilus biogenesis protein CpaD/CtpE